MKRIALSLAALVLSCAAALGQQAPWSLSDCISYALDHNLTLKQSGRTV